MWSTSENKQVFSGYIKIGKDIYDGVTIVWTIGGDNWPFFYDSWLTIRICMESYLC